MKKIFFILTLFYSIILACSGDCTSCHSNVNYKDNDHKIMLNCKTCHTDEKLARVQMQSSCGQDCFACHNIENINKIKNKEHLALNSCINCHNYITLKNRLNTNINPLFDSNFLRKK
ncbi:MAG: hypothetical protein K2P17_08145 [Helicobacteraceae bacterium]|nr:hypothetical protein [Helicobacteraceae bacterium]